MVDRAHANQIFRRGGRGYAFGFNNQNYRRLRILSSTFFELEKEGAVLYTCDYPVFYLEFREQTVGNSTTVGPSVARSNTARQ